MIRCTISLGGNVGDVPATFDRAQRALSGHPGIANLAASRRFRTTPMGPRAGAEFLNAAATFETSLDAEPLLDLLQLIERDCGRVCATRWGPRTLDLDLLLYGEEIIDTPRLRVPHPALWHRRFVLDPLCELIPGAIHSQFGLTIRQLRERLLPRPLPVCFLPTVAWAAPSKNDVAMKMVGTAHPTEAAIVFAALEDEAPWPQVVRLPEEKSAAIQLATDVLTAALDEPAVAQP
jgi:2-amino-4-hydroxy-6-hydroxymethyldihydropteridine diphosphokinase